MPTFWLVRLAYTMDVVAAINSDLGAEMEPQLGAQGTSGVASSEEVPFIFQPIHKSFVQFANSSKDEYVKTVPHPPPSLYISP
jgi:hypothetical protein